MPFIPHTAADIHAMLETIGITDSEQLFAEIPQALKATHFELEAGLSEMQLQRLMQARAAQDAGALCFMGAGAYEHHIPAAVWDIASRGEFMTAYTPYQAEASQGTLQLLYEYQTMMASLTGMDVSNASLYDGASALAEAVLMAVRANRQAKSKRILVPTSLHPRYRQVLNTLVTPQQLELIELPYCPSTGHILLEQLSKYETYDIAALIIPQPNFFGVLEPVDALTDWAERHQVMSIAVVNPTAIALLKEPGQWGQQGVDIVCGEGQPLGIPLASGGPYFGFIGCKQAHVRQMPGRIVGRTLDTQNRTGFTLTLQAREQHIRRSKATSNICTNQGLLVTAATIYMSLLGPDGLKQVAAACHTQTRQLVNALTALPDVKLAWSSPYFHEAVLLINQPVATVLARLAEVGIQGGYDLSTDYPELGSALLVCATETKLPEDIAYYQQQLAAILEN